MSALPSLVVAYEVPETCPDFASYARQVQERASRFEVTLGEPAVGSGGGDIEIHLHESGAGYTGQLSMRLPSPLQREVKGEHCADVVAALALITVLRLEAEPAVQPPPAVTAAPEAPAAPAAPATPDAPAAAEAPATPEAPAAAEAPAAPEAPAAAESPAEPEAPMEPVAPAAPATSEASIRAEQGEEQTDPEELDDDEPARLAVEQIESPGEDGGLGGGAAVTERVPLAASAVAYLGYASVPAHALEVALEGELRFGSEATAWATAFTLALARGATASSSGQATLTLATAQLAVCPPGLGLGRSWLQACAFARAGLLDFSTSQSEVPIESIDIERPWAAAGASAELGVPLSSRWSLRWLGELGVQLVRDRFEVERIALDGEPRLRVELYRPEVFSVELALGLAYAF